VHTGHTACQNVPIKAFILKNFFSRTKSGVEKLNRVLERKNCPLFRLRTASYTFAVAASRLLKYRKFKF
jgi:hypothetical protein